MKLLYNMNILSEEEEDDFDEEESLSYYNNENQIIVSLGTDYKTLPDEWWNDSKNNVDLLMLKKSLCDNIKYKIFHKHKELMKSDINWVDYYGETIRASRIRTR